MVEMGVQDLCGVGIMAPSGRGLPRERVGERQKDWQQLAGLSLPQSASLTAPSQREPFALHTLVRPYPGAEESAAIVLAAKRSPLRTPKRWSAAPKAKNCRSAAIFLTLLGRLPD